MPCVASCFTVCWSGYGLSTFSANQASNRRAACPFRCFGGRRDRPLGVVVMWAAAVVTIGGGGGGVETQYCSNTATLWFTRFDRASICC